MLRAMNLDCGHERPPVLCGVNLELRAGEVVGLLGPNGSGKSTLLLTLSGVLPPLAGEVALMKRPLPSFPPRDRARLLACAPQRAEAPEGLTLRDLVLMGRYPHLGFWERCGGKDHEAADAALAAMDISGLALRRARQVSGGELQRAFLARTLAQVETSGPAVLLLDEPATGLDPAHAVTACEALVRRAEEGAAVFMASHDFNLAAMYCDRLVFLHQGRVLAQGATREIFTRDILETVYDTSFTIFEHPGPLGGAVPQAVLDPRDPGAVNGAYTSDRGAGGSDGP